MNIFKKFTWPAWVMILAAALLSCFFVFSTFEEVKPEPTFDQFCKPEVINKIYNNEQDCKKAEGEWTPNNVAAPYPADNISPQNTTNEKISMGYCNASAKCSKEHDVALKSYRTIKYAFISIFALLLLLLGLFVIRKYALVSYASLISGLFILVVIHISNWDILSGFARPIILLIGLGLVVFAMRRYEE